MIKDSKLYDIIKVKTATSVNQEPSSICSVIVFSFGIGLLLSGEFAQGIVVALF